MREPDAEVVFELTAKSAGRERRRVTSGYRPIYDITSDYWTSTNHEFVDVDHVSTGESARAYVWFLTPEEYRGTLWEGRTLNVAEGVNRIVGKATVVRVLNPVLRAATAE